MRISILPVCIAEYARELAGLLFGEGTEMIAARLRRHLYELLPVLLFSLLGAGSVLVFPPLLSEILDVGIPEIDIPFVLLRVLLLTACAAASLFFSAAVRFFAQKAAAITAAEIRHILFKHIQRMQCRDLDRVGIHALASLLTEETDRLQCEIRYIICIFLQSLFLICGTVLIAFTAGPEGGILLSGSVLAFACIEFLSALFTIPLFFHSGEHRGVHPTENDDSGCTAASKPPDPQEICSSRSLAERIDSSRRLLLVCAFTAAMFLLCGRGLLRIQSGTLTSGGLAAQMFYLLLSVSEIRKLSELILIAADAGNRTNRIRAILDFETESCLSPEAETPLPEDAGSVLFRRVSQKYPCAGKESLSGISFRVRRSQIIGIFGGAGSGKSTLVRLIARLYDPTAGTVEVNGMDVRLQAPARLRSRIGIVPGNPHFFRGTIRDNLKLGDPSASDDDLFRAASSIRVEDHLFAAGGLDGETEIDGRNLSPAQRLYLALTRVLVRKPDILILDDCTSVLSSAEEARLRLAIRRLEFRPTVFIVSRRISSVRFADRILVLNEGRAVGFAPHERLLTDCPVYREFYASQMQEEFCA